MSDPFLDIEASEESSQPREIYDISHGTTAYRFTTAMRDIPQDGFIYKATAASRGALPVDATPGEAEKEVTITLPIDHAFVRRYLRQADPPGLINVTIRRINGANIETIFAGEITYMSVDDEGTEATFQCMSRLGKKLLRIAPHVPAKKTCPHDLYGTMCGVDRADFDVAGTVTAVDGRDVFVDTGILLFPDYVKDGEFWHTASGEKFTIKTQVHYTGTIEHLTIDKPCADIKVGDAVVLYAGCDHTLQECVDQFNNRNRFGGLPQLPTDNPFVSVSTGVED